MAGTASAASPVLRAEAISVSYGERMILEDLSLDIPAGRVTALIGPNGSGKSTLLKALGRLLPPSRGGITLEGRPLAAIDGRSLARALSLLPQGPVSPEGITVRELVAFGRYPHRRFWRGQGPEDLAAIERAIALTGLSDLADRPLDALSGGQQQRAWIAMTTAQEAGVMLLDEPITYLDVAHQIDILTLLGRLNREAGRSIVLVLHDLNLAARHADHIVALRAGRIVTQGPPEAVICPDVLQQVFALDAHVLSDPATARPWAIPLPRDAGGAPQISGDA